MEAKDGDDAGKLEVCATYKVKVDQGTPAPAALWIPQHHHNHIENIRQNDNDDDGGGVYRECPNDNLLAPPGLHDDDDGDDDEVDEDDDDSGAQMTIYWRHLACNTMAPGLSHWYTFLSHNHHPPHDNIVII